MNYRQAAAYLGVSERTVWGLRDSGRLKSIRIGASVRFDVQDLDAYIEAQKSGEEARNG